MRTRIKEYRAKFNMTQEELAKRVGVRRETIVFLEKGKYNPSLKLAYKIARVFNAKIEDLFIFDEEELWERK
jgi:putative transcriptional regulator